MLFCYSGAYQCSKVGSCNPHLYYIKNHRFGYQYVTPIFPFTAYEYLPDSEVATIASVSDKNVLSISEEEETIEIEKDTESDTSEAGSSPFFCNTLEETIEVIEGSSVR